MHGGYYNVYWYLLLAMLQSSCVVAGGHLWLSWYHLPSCKWWISDQQHMLTAHCPLQANLIPTQFTVLKGGSKHFLQPGWSIGNLMANNLGWIRLLNKFIFKFFLLSLNMWLKPTIVSVAEAVPPHCTGRNLLNYIHHISRRPGSNQIHNFIIYNRSNIHRRT